MAKRKKKQRGQIPGENGIRLRVLSAPYAIDEEDSPQVQYERYMEDPDRHMEIDGVEYYKIINAYAMRLRGQKIIVAVVENSMDGRIGDILSDEDDREFPVTAIETLQPAEITECCRRTTYLALEVTSIKIGKYLTVKERRPAQNFLEKCKNFFHLGDMRT